MNCAFFIPSVNMKADSRAVMQEDGSMQNVYTLIQRWANLAMRGICLSQTVSGAHVVDGFLVLLLKVNIIFWRYVTVKFKQSSVIFN